MQIIPGSTARPLPSDRNAAAKDLTYRVQNAVPHARTERATYTVPANKRAVLASVFTLIYRSAAPTTTGKANIFIQLTRSGAGAVDQYELAHFAALAGGLQQLGYGVNVELFEGDKIDIETADASNGGTLDFTASLAIMEYDA